MAASDNLLIMRLVIISKLLERTQLTFEKQGYLAHGPWLFAVENESHSGKISFQRATCLFVGHRQICLAASHHFLIMLLIIINKMIRKNAAKKTLRLSSEVSFSLCPSLSLWLALGFQIYRCIGPVSYTHLDVYKRQPSRRASYRPLTIRLPLIR